MAATKLNTVLQQRINTYFPNAEVWKVTKQFVVLFFPSEDEAYLYDVTDWNRYKHVPGRPILSFERKDSGIEEFKAQVEFLTKAL